MAEGESYRDTERKSYRETKRRREGAILICEQMD
jgi:hypothetical protein